MTVLTVPSWLARQPQPGKHPAGAELLAELHLQAGLWRQLAPSGPRDGVAVRRRHAERLWRSPDYVHQLSATAASSDEHVRSLAETCVRRLRWPGFPRGTSRSAPSL